MEKVYENEEYLRYGLVCKFHMDKMLEAKTLLGILYSQFFQSQERADALHSRVDQAIRCQARIRAGLPTSVGDQPNGGRGGVE